MISHLCTNTPSETDVGEDYITNFPESIISHILSCLTTKEAVRTSVLSKDWKYKWTSIYNINITDLQDSYADSKIEAFLGFIEHISQTCLSNHVRSFHLRCKLNYKSDRLMSWVLPVLGPNLEEFTLIWNQNHYQKFGLNLILPQGFLLKCTSLRSLSVMQWFSLPVLIIVPRFPCLISLHLHGVAILNENSNSDSMVLKFPVLKTFDICDSKWLNVKSVEIHAPLLHKFSCLSRFNGAIHIYSIKIVGANNIAEFDVWGYLMNWFILGGSKVSHASFHCQCQSPIVEQVLQSLFNDLSSSVTSLTFECSFQNCPISSIVLPRFDKLEELVLRRDDSAHDLLVELFRASPHLKSLKVSQDFEFEDSHLVLPQLNKLEKLVLEYYGGVPNLIGLLHAAPHLKFLQINGFSGEDFDCNVESVPHCIAFSLVKVIFSYVCCRYPYRESHIEGYILKFGAQLERFLFSVDDNCASRKNIALRQDEMFTWLKTLPAASASLSIETFEYEI